MLAVPWGDVLVRPTQWYRRNSHPYGPLVRAAVVTKLTTYALKEVYHPDWILWMSRAGEDFGGFQEPPEVQVAVRQSALCARACFCERMCAHVLLFVASMAKLSLCCNCSGMGTERTTLITINCPTVFG